MFFYHAHENGWLLAYIIISLVYFIVTIKVYVPTLMGSTARCFSILIYFGPNPQTDFTYLNLSSLIPSISFSDFFFILLRGHRHGYKIHLVFQWLMQSLNAHKCAYFFYYISSSLTMHPPQYFHIYYNHFSRVLFPNWPIFCSIS